MTTQRLGGILSLTLGAVLLTGGALGTGQAIGGSQTPTCGALVVGSVQPCATGTLSVTKIVTGQGVAVCPSGWRVTGGGNTALPNDTNVGNFHYSLRIIASYPSAVNAWKVTAIEVVTDNSTHDIYATLYYTPTVRAVCVY